MRYVGWGGLPQAFDLDHPQWRTEAEELRQLLDPHDYAQARRSTQDAHYTSQEVILGLYDGLEKLGFQGPANILEPAAGIGHFRGLMPDRLRAAPQDFLALELDPLTAGIGACLYPDAAFVNKGFQDMAIPQGSFDLALGNPPFGSQKLHDPQYPGLDFSIHNFFLAKSIASLRPGGLAAFVISRYFLDAVVNPAREYLAERANLLGAIRLPNNAFKRNANTEVTTDIVFFQRTDQPEQNPAWLRTGTIPDSTGQPITLNQYYLDYPGQMIGRMALTNGMFQKSAELLPPPVMAGFREEIAARLDVLPRSIYQPRAGFEPGRAEDRPDPNLNLCAHLKVDAYFVTQAGAIATRRPDLFDRPGYELVEPKNKRAGERIKGLIKIRNLLTDLMAWELKEDSLPDDLVRRRVRLNREYDLFVRQYGFLNSSGNRQAFKADPEYALLAGLEQAYDPGLSPETAQREGRSPRPPSAVKADIFTRRVLEPRRRIERVETAKEALIVSMNEYGRPDLDFMSGLGGQSPDDLTRDLAGLIYLNPAGRAWELADHYLTGQVKAKLAEAEAAAPKEPQFRANVEALKLVQPPDLEPVDIAVQLGSTWVPAEDVADFARHLFGPDCVKEFGYHQALGAWVAAFNLFKIDQTLTTATWGTERFPGHRLMEAVLNNGSLRVMDEVGQDPETGRPILKLNEPETAAAAQKADEMRQEFLNWVWRD
ncbi:MAG: helicase, partial [Candidatus Adiutrix sp.]|nr:helicase [Candidatus Adiutrix sp.]